MTNWDTNRLPHIPNPHSESSLVTDHDPETLNVMNDFGSNYGSDTSSILEDPDDGDFEILPPSVQPTPLSSNEQTQDTNDAAGFRKLQLRHRHLTTTHTTSAVDGAMNHGTAEWEAKR
jgi:hypothetical protein